MAIVTQTIGATTADLEETLAYASDKLTVYSVDVGVLAQAALGETGVLRYTFLHELDIKVERVESALVTLRAMSKELAVRAERLAG